MQTDLFASKTIPSFLAAHRGVAKGERLSSPPPRRNVAPKPALEPQKDASKEAKKPLFTHFALVSASTCPPRKKPFKPWPKHCPQTFWLMHENEKDARGWITKTNGSVYKAWLCRFCKKWHAEPYPQEITGTTSGKSVRKWNFLIRKGVPFEEVYDLPKPKENQ